MEFSGIYAITDDKLLAGSKLLEASTAALENGISLLQYRCKSVAADLRLAQARELVALCARFDVPLIINDDIELCVSTQASGVHLGRHDASLISARKRLGADAIIGVSCHSSIENAILAEQHGANYVAFGRFFPSTSKPNAAAAEPAVLAEARQKLSIPIVAIGGINAQNGASIVAAGADMLALIDGLFGQPDVAEQTRNLLRLFQQEH